MDPERAFFRVHARLSGVFTRILTPRLRTFLEASCLTLGVALLLLLLLLHSSAIQQPMCSVDLPSRHRLQKALLIVRIGDAGSVLHVDQSQPFSSSLRWLRSRCSSCLHFQKLAVAAYQWWQKGSRGGGEGRGKRGEDSEEVGRGSSMCSKQTLSDVVLRERGSWERDWGLRVGVKGRGRRREEEVKRSSRVWKGREEKEAGRGGGVSWQVGGEKCEGRNGDWSALVAAWWQAVSSTGGMLGGGGGRVGSRGVGAEDVSQEERSGEMERVGEVLAAADLEESQERKAEQETRSEEMNVEGIREVGADDSSNGKKQQGDVEMNASGGASDGSVGSQGSSKWWQVTGNRVMSSLMLLLGMAQSAAGHVAADICFLLKFLLLLLRASLNRWLLSLKEPEAASAAAGGGWGGGGGETGAIVGSEDPPWTASNDEFEHHFGGLGVQFLRVSAPAYVFSPERGYLLLSAESLASLGIQQINVTIPLSDPCFGACEWMRALTDAFVGYDSLLLKFMAAKYKNGYLLNSATHDVFNLAHLHLLTPADAAPTIEELLIFKLGVLITSLFVFFMTTMAVSFTLRQTQSRMLNFTVALQHHARHQLPTFHLIFIHVMESLVFVPIMIGVLFFLFEFYGQQLLSFLVLTLVWLCEIFTLISVRTAISMHLFPRFFFLYFLLFHIYFFSLDEGFPYLAFATTALFIQHAVIVFWNRFEVPALEALLRIPSYLGQHHRGARMFRANATPLGAQDPTSMWPTGAGLVSALSGGGMPREGNHGAPGVARLLGTLVVTAYAMVPPTGEGETEARSNTMDSTTSMTQVETSAISPTHEVANNASEVADAPYDGQSQTWLRSLFSWLITRRTNTI